MSAEPARGESVLGIVSVHAGVVVVRLGSAEFGLPVVHVREVLRTPQITRVPFPPPAVCGAVAIRGAIVPVLDLGVRLSGRPSRRPGTVVVVVDATDQPTGLLVDSVVGLVDADTAPVHEAPEEAGATLRFPWVTEVLVPEGGRPVAVLDLAGVLAHATADPAPNARDPQSNLSQTPG